MLHVSDLHTPALLLELFLPDHNPVLLTTWSLLPVLKVEEWSWSRRRAVGPREQGW